MPLSLVRLLSLVALLAGACATPPIELTQRFTPGEVRRYRLTADATTTIDVAGTRESRRSLLVARTRIEVLGLEEDGGARLRLLVEPVSLTEDGRPSPVPGRQEAEVTVAADGRVSRVTAIGGLPAPIVGESAQDLAGVIGAPLPARRMRLGDRFDLPDEGSNPRALVRGRVAGLRVVDGHDTAIVRLSIVRPIVRDGGRFGLPISLAGDDVSAQVVSFDFREGLAIRIESEGEARLRVSGPEGGATPGGVVIRTRSTLSLVSRAGGGS